MRKITFSQATQEAMAETMAKDPTVFAMGEDLARQGGIFGQFKGLPQQFISLTKITGSFQAEATFMASWKVPRLEAPSPKNTTETRSFFRIILLARAAPVARL